MQDVDVTRLLESISAGDECGHDRLVELLYSELRRLAGSLMRREREGHTLQPTALVNEAYLALVRSDSRWENRAHFFGAAAQAMRQILVMHARQRMAQKRGGEAERITFDDLQVHSEEPETDLLALDEALKALAAQDPQLSRFVELRYFAGCSLEEVAELTSRSLASVKRDWVFAKAWLYDYMTK